MQNLAETSLIREATPLRLATILIAAGNSSRLGHAKQLVKLGKENLLQKSAKLAEKISNQAYCVLGSDSENMKEQLRDIGIEILINNEWEEGMGRSIACGIKKVKDNFDAALILLCDQWMLTKSDLEQLKESWIQEPEKIIACEYTDQRKQKKIIGAPAIFPKHHFGALESLGEKGARGIIEKYSEQCIVIPTFNAGFDLDTPEDLEFFESQCRKG